MRLTIQIILFLAIFAVFGFHYQVLAEDGYVYNPSNFQYQSSGTSTGGTQVPYASSGSSTGGSDFTSKLINKFQTVAKGWEKTFHAIAIKIFWILAAIALFIKFAPIMAGGGSRDLGDFARELVMFVLSTGVIFYLVKNGPELFLDLFNFFTEAGKEAAGTNGGPQEILSATMELVKGILNSLASGHEEFAKQMEKYGPNVSIWDAGSIIVQALESTFLFLAKLIIGILALWCCLIAAVLAAIVAIKYAVVLAAAYIIAYAGIIILGFAGWGYTRDVIASYFKTAAGIGIQLMCYVLMMGLGRGLILEQAKKLSTGADSIAQLGEYFAFLLCMIMWFELIKLVPPMVAGIAGAPTMREPSVKSMGAMAALSLAPLALPAAGAAGGAAGAAGAKAAAAAAGTTATKGQVFAGALKGAMGNMKEAGGRAVKQAVDGGSFGSVMKSAVGAENTGPSSPKAAQERQKQAQEEQRQAKRDEMQAQTLQAIQAIAGGAGQGQGQGGNSADTKDAYITVDANARAEAAAKAEAPNNNKNDNAPRNGGMGGANSGINVDALGTTEAGAPQSSGSGAPAATSPSPSSNGSFFQRLFNRGKEETVAHRAAEEKFFHTNDNVQKPQDE